MHGRTPQTRKRTKRKSETEKPHLRDWLQAVPTKLLGSGSQGRASERASVRAHTHAAAHGCPRD